MGSSRSFSKDKRQGHRATGSPPEIRCDTHHYGVGSVGAKICITLVSLFLSSNPQKLSAIVFFLSSKITKMSFCKV